MCILQLWTIEKKSRPAWDFKAQEQGWGEFPWFGFCLIFLRFGAEEDINPEMPMGTDFFFF